MKLKWRTITTAGVASLLIASQALSISADTADDIAYLEQQQAQANAELYAVQETINNLEAQKSQLLAQIDAYDTQLVNVITTIKLLDEQIVAKEAELVQTGEDLEAAEEELKKQYEAMKERIRFLYEEGGDAGWAAMLLAEGVGISNILDKADYTQKLYDYDRKELTAYTESIQNVENLQTLQTMQKAALETVKHEQEDSQKYLEELLKQTEEKSEDMDTRLAEANAIAENYYYLIEQQNIAIGQLYARQEAERIAAEQAAAAAAAQAAAEQAAAEQAAAQQAAAQQAAVVQDVSVYEEYTDDSYVESYSEPVYDTSSGYEESYVDTTADTSDAYTEPAAETASYSAPAVGANGVSGQDVVNYALQYVGNPYVWGGTDPVNGADCSGFVQSVYRDMGYDISRTTYTQLNDGVSVSYADAQPGDLINYGSHVAIYMGDGQIVHAANEQLGITTSTNATYQPIVDVRRIIN